MVYRPQVPSACSHWPVFRFSTARPTRPIPSLSAALPVKRTTPAGTLLLLGLTSSPDGAPVGGVVVVGGVAAGGAGAAAGAPAMDPSPPTRTSPLCGGRVRLLTTRPSRDRALPPRSSFWVSPVGFTTEVPLVNSRT